MATTIRSMNLVDFFAGEISQEANESLSFPQNIQDKPTEKDLADFTDPLDEEPLLRTVSSEIDEFAATVGEAFSCFSGFHNQGNYMDPPGSPQESMDRDCMTLWEMEKVRCTSSKNHLVCYYPDPEFAFSMVLFICHL